MKFPVGGKTMGVKRVADIKKGPWGMSEDFPINWKRLNKELKLF